MNSQSIYAGNPIILVIARGVKAVSRRARLAPLVMSASVGLIMACGSSTSSPAVSAISLSPSPCGVGRTNSLQMHAEAVLPDGTKKDVTALSTWSSANTQTATVNPGGNVVGVNTGVTSITASYLGASGDLNCTVTP